MLEYLSLHQWNNAIYIILRAAPSYAWRDIVNRICLRVVLLNNFAAELM